VRPSLKIDRSKSTIAHHVQTRSGQMHCLRPIQVVLRELQRAFYGVRFASVEDEKR
jgi:hypothetical protein